MRRSNRSGCFDEGMTSDMEDCIVVGSLKRNKDGSITISCQIDVIDHETGQCWGVDTKVIRLPKKP